MPRIRLQLVIACSAPLLAVAAALWFHARAHRQINLNSADELRHRADDLAWNNQWLRAQPLYMRAERLYNEQNRSTDALYVHVSQFILRAEREPGSRLLLELDEALRTREAENPIVKLRILEIEGMIATNYDGPMARATWSQVQDLASSQHQYRLMMRAIGEQGIADFLLGDIAQAKKLVIRAWTGAKLLHDPAARVRYASVYGAGLVEIQRYDEALHALNEAISVAESSDGVAYPSIAINSKIDALCGLHRYDEALQLADEAIRRLPEDGLDAHRFQLLTSKGEIYRNMGQWSDATTQYAQALLYARRLQYWRGIVQTGGLQATALERQGRLDEGLASIEEALEANTHIPEELYFSPRNMAIKARILEKMGHTSKARTLYERSAQLMDSLIATAPTPNVERQLITEMQEVYADYYELLCNHGKLNEAFRVIEKERGRVEAEALKEHAPARPHLPSPQEKQINELNLALLKTDGPDAIQQLHQKLYDAELELDGSSFAGKTALAPIPLETIQHSLRPNELLLEYVVSDSASSVLSITDREVHRYPLPSWKLLKPQIASYRAALKARKTDAGLGSTLFRELLGSIGEYNKKSSVLIVPDEDLHLLPFSALVDQSKFAIEDHTFSNIPSATVLCLLRKRNPIVEGAMNFVGVAAWTGTQSNSNARVTRSGISNLHSLPALPQSAHEVQVVAQDLKGPGTILMGAQATESRFKSLPLEKYRVLHLALHGYADVEFPDRSALVFAAQDDGRDDGLLEAREIRNLHLDAQLVTLSACDTGVGPVGASDIANLVNAFIEAGSATVVSSQWELEDAATDRLMTSFYGSLAQGNTTVEALRQGQLQLLHAGLSPYYWASFQVAGNPAGKL